LKEDFDGDNVKKHALLVILIVVNLIVGLLILPGYGESMDELMQRQYGERTAGVFESLLSSGSTVVKERPRQGSHGPAFITAVVLLKNLFVAGGTVVQKLRFSHFMYFVMFQVGVAALYFLALRWVGNIAAFGAALLFSTQPLLVGHAFINPKDTVLMSLMITNIVTGMALMDREESSFRSTGRWFKDASQSFLMQFLRWDVWLAGFLLGFTSAVRIVALLIGAILLGYILVSRKWQVLPRLVAYGLIAFAFMFLLWPYLWADPLGRLAEVLQNSAYYPDVHLTLFKGVLVEASQTPRSYLPVLMPIQLTETTLLLIIVGAIALLKKIRWDLVILFGIWFVLPVLGVIGIRMNLYNNFRQLFFILPPLFLIAGLGLDWLLALLRRPVFQALLLFLVVLPGLYANIALYPYQYIYYNQLAGGLRGAYRVYELDYWNLAFEEAQTYINDHARENADIYAGDAKQTAQTFARPDLVFNALGGRKSNWEQYDYIIVTTAQNIDEQYAGLPTVFTVEREGVPLVYVKKPK
jgi:hypothetical protein